jgi:hypothetical protein
MKTQFQQSNKQSNKTAPYLSISYTEYDDLEGPEGGMTTSMLCYDINSAELETVYKFPYSSQYPLGCLDLANQKVYFSALSETSINRDELFVCDLNTNEIRQLTDDFFAINFILPRKDDVLLAAVKTRTRAIRPVVYDVTEGTLTYGALSDDDTCIQFMSVAADGTGDIYASVYSDASRYAASEKHMELGYYPIPNYTVVRYHGADLTNPETIFVAEAHEVKSVSSNGKFIFTRETIDMDKLIYKLYMFDIENGIKEEITIPEVESCSSLQMNSDASGVYFIGVLKASIDIRGIYYYDFSSKQIDTVMIQEAGVGFINNYVLFV